MRCEVCGAPPLPLAGACAFCRAPLEAEADASGLVDYVASRLPFARATGSGLLRRGPIDDLRVEAAGTRYRARVRGGQLRLEPEAPPAEWVDGLVAALSRNAATAPSVRSAVTRAGWALR